MKTTTGTVAVVCFFVGIPLLTTYLHFRFHALRRFHNYRIKKPSGIDFISTSGQIGSTVHRGTIAATLTSTNLYIRESVIPFFPKYWRFPKGALKRIKSGDWDHSLSIDGNSAHMGIRFERQ